MRKHTDKSGPKTVGRYQKLLKGEITSDQYVNWLRKDARTQRPARTGKSYSTSRRSAGA